MASQWPKHSPVACGQEVLIEDEALGSAVNSAPGWCHRWIEEGGVKRSPWGQMC